MAQRAGGRVADRAPVCQRIDEGLPALGVEQVGAGEHPHVRLPNALHADHAVILDPTHGALARLVAEEGGHTPPGPELGSLVTGARLVHLLPRARVDGLLVEECIQLLLRRPPLPLVPRLRQVPPQLREQPLPLFRGVEGDGGRVRGLSQEAEGPGLAGSHGPCPSRQQGPEAPPSAPRRVLVLVVALDPAARMVVEPEVAAACGLGGNDKVLLQLPRPVEATIRLPAHPLG